MKKTVKYAGRGALIVGIGNALLNAIQQLNSIDENPEKEFDWGELILAGGKGALTGAAGGAVVGGILDYQNSKEAPLNTSAIINTIVSDLTLDKTSSEYIFLSRKADNLIKIIEREFQRELGGHLLKIGSTEDGTALNYDFDIDISVPFSPNSFSSVEVMYNEVYDFLNRSYNDEHLKIIRKQGKSLGLIYTYRGEVMKIDIVPYKQNRNANNKTTGYLYVNKNSLFEPNGYTKTDIRALKAISLSHTQQKILIVLKNWKEIRSVPIGSHLLKLFILDAYAINRGNIPGRLTDKVIMVLSHIENGIMTRRIVSTENSNNVLTDLSQDRKREIVLECKRLLDDYEYQPNSILEYLE